MSVSGVKTGMAHTRCLIKKILKVPPVVRTKCIVAVAGILMRVMLGYRNAITILLPLATIISVCA